MFSLYIYINRSTLLYEWIFQSYQISVEQQLLSSSEFNNGNEFNTS